MSPYSAQYCPADAMVQPTATTAGQKGLMFLSVFLAAMGATTLLVGALAQEPATQNAMVAPVTSTVRPAMPGLTPWNGLSMAPRPVTTVNPSRPTAVTPLMAGAAAPADYDDSDVLKMDEAEFEAITGGDTPVLVDYYATWCGPCRLMDPTIARLATEYKGKLLVYKMDCGANGAKCRELGIKMLPTFQMYKSGQMLDEMFGTSSDKLVSMIDKATK